MYNNEEIAIESFISYCDNMMIAEEGIIKNFIKKRNEKKELKRRYREKSGKMNQLIYKYTKKYIEPKFDKISNEIKNQIEKECKNKKFIVKLTSDSGYADNRLSFAFTFIEGYKIDFNDRNNDTSDICDDIVEEVFSVIKNKYTEFYEMMDFEGDYGDPGNFGFEIDLDSLIVSKYLEKFADFKKEREELENAYSDIK